MDLGLKDKSALITGGSRGIGLAVAKGLATIARFADPEELANFFVFLCSPKASYCVGSTYHVDGGWLRVVV